MKLLLKKPATVSLDIRQYVIHKNKPSGHTKRSKGPLQEYVPTGNGSLLYDTSNKSFIFHSITYSFELFVLFFCFKTMQRGCRSNLDCITVCTVVLFPQFTMIGCTRNTFLSWQCSGTVLRRHWQDGTMF